MLEGVSVGEKEGGRDKLFLSYNEFVPGVRGAPSVSEDVINY